MEGLGLSGPPPLVDAGFVAFRKSILTYLSVYKVDDEDSLNTPLIFSRLLLLTILSVSK
jgi:hypothetical protein